MAAVILTFLVCWAILVAGAHLPIGRALCRLLVEAPAARLTSITRGDVAIGIVLAIGVAMIAFVAEDDGMRLLTFAAPDIAMWITTFEVSAYLDIAVAIVTAASSGRLRGAIQRAIATWRVGRRGSAGRAVRTQPARRLAASNDDDERPAAMMAA